eukprot:1086573-Rhodomonas_salina.2
MSAFSGMHGSSHMCMPPLACMLSPTCLLPLTCTLPLTRVLLLTHLARASTLSLTHPARHSGHGALLRARIHAAVRRTLPRLPHPGPQTHPPNTPRPQCPASFQTIPPHLERCDITRAPAGVHARARQKRACTAPQVPQASGAHGGGSRAGGSEGCAAEAAGGAESVCSESAGAAAAIQGDRAGGEAREGGEAGEEGGDREGAWGAGEGEEGGAREGGGERGRVGEVCGGGAGPVWRCECRGAREGQGGGCPQDYRGLSV